MTPTVTLPSVYVTMVTLPCLCVTLYVCYTVSLNPPPGVGSVGYRVGHTGPQHPHVTAHVIDMTRYRPTPNGRLLLMEVKGKR